MSLDQLNSLLEEAERRIISLQTGVRASVPIDETGTFLLHMKQDGCWGLYVSGVGSGEALPLLKTSVRIRLLAAHKLRELDAAIDEAIATRAGEVERAIAAVRDYLARPGPI